MMSVGIKNAILLLLIIMILHFLIMNVLVEKSSSSKETTPKKMTEAFKKEADETVVKSDEIDKKQDDLMAYVSSSNEFEEYVDANEAKFEKNMPIICDTKTIMNDEEQIVTKVPKKTKIYDDKINNNNFLVIQEYEDESSLNGGKVFDGLCGYDEYGDTYQSI